ncbi:MAG: hypothetical protein HYW50_04735 [Candidatus Diapherotrites archaeon]|nr:hypothetical protein [Candidatus Diapherotrites archaeon]
MVEIYNKNALRVGKMVLLQLGLLAVAFLVLVKSASIAIKKLVKISRHFGLPEFTISFLVVGIVAIFPELAIGINAAIAGNPSLGLGIVFGSNIADLTLIIGIVVLSSRTVRLHEFALKQMTLLVFATILPFAFLLDGEISRADGAMLLLAFAFYVYRMLKIHKNSEDKTVIKEKANVLQEIFLLWARVFQSFQLRFQRQGKNMRNLALETF